MAYLSVHFINEKTKTQGAVKQINEEPLSESQCPNAGSARDTRN